MTSTANAQPGPPNKSGNPTSLCLLCDPPKQVTTRNLKAHQGRVHDKGRGTVTKIGQRAFKKKAPASAKRVSTAHKRASAGRRAARAATPRDVALPIVLTPGDDGDTTFRVLDNFIVLAGSDGHIYVAERIK